MSDGFKDNLDDLKNAFEGSKDYNRYLIYKYPWLMPNDIDEDSYDYEFTFLDDMPKGWKKAFGLKLCEEIQKILDNNITSKLHLIQVKEKFGGLRFYYTVEDKTEKEIDTTFDIENIIDKYEKLSYKTCINCGKPATKISLGWISPWCDKCASKLDIEFEDIK